MKRARRRARPRAPALPPPRNPVAQSPMLRKGGAHDKSVGARRRQARVALQRQLREQADTDE
jgi:hypothetical protein